MELKRGRLSNKRCTTETMKFSKTFLLLLGLSVGVIFAVTLSYVVLISLELIPDSSEQLLTLALTGCYYVGLPFYHIGKTAFEYFVVCAHYKEDFVEQLLYDFPSLDAAIKNTKNFVYHAWTMWPLKFEETVLYGLLFSLVCYSVIMTSTGTLASKQRKERQNAKTGPQAEVRQVLYCIKNKKEHMQKKRLTKRRRRTGRNGQGR